MSTNAKRTRVIVVAMAVVLLVCAALQVGERAQAQAAPAAGAGWETATGALPGPPASIAMAPDGSQIVVGVMRKGFYGSNDGGATWEKLGAGDKEQVKSLCTDIVFDPKDPKTFWVSGAYERSIFKTTDGGKTFQPNGPVWHLDNIAVDFSDPLRQTLVAGMHESPGRIFRSVDGGKKWYSLSKPRPGVEGFPSVYGPNSPVVLDANTYVIGCLPGWMGARGNKPAIVRTDDGGLTWTKVSDIGPTGGALVASDGAIYWPAGRGLVKSNDKGKTWEKMDAVSTTPVELPDKSLVSSNGKQLYTSADAGKTWVKCGPQAPDTLQKVMYSIKEKAVFASVRSGNGPTKLCKLRLGE